MYLSLSLSLSLSIYLSIYISIYIYIYTHISIPIYVYIYNDISIACVYTCVYVNTCHIMYIYIYIYTHTYIVPLGNRQDVYLFVAMVSVVDSIQRYLYMVSVLGLFMVSVVAGNMCLWFPPFFVYGFRRGRKLVLF